MLHRWPKFWNAADDLHLCRPKPKHKLEFLARNKLLYNLRSSGSPASPAICVYATASSAAVRKPENKNTVTSKSQPENQAKTQCLCSFYAKTKSRHSKLYLLRFGLVLLRGQQIYGNYHVIILIGDTVFWRC